VNATYQRRGSILFAIALIVIGAQPCWSKPEDADTGSAQEKRLDDVFEAQQREKYHGSPTQALNRLSQIIAIKPAKAQFLERAWVYLYLGRLEEAFADLNTSMNTPLQFPTFINDKLVNSDAGWAAFHKFTEYSTRAFAYLRTNQTQNALADCKVAVNFRPTSGFHRGVAVLAFCLLRLGEYETARSVCDAIIESPPGSLIYPGSFLYVLRARAYIGLKEYERALKDCEQAITMRQKRADATCFNDQGPCEFTYCTLMGEPDCSSGLLAKAETLNCLKRYKEARESVDQIIASEPRLDNICGIGMRIRNCKDDKPTIVSDVLEDGPAHKSGVLVGDHIVEIDGKQTRGWSAQEIANHIRGPKGSDVTLTIDRKGQPLKFTINRTYENLAYYDSRPLLLRAYELRGQLCKELGLASDAEQSFAEARKLGHVEER
jgi:tetratricopeptide (TPR) repeat protein